MPKTIQVVTPDRIEPTADGKSIYIYFVDNNGSEWEALVSAERVIELTEERATLDLIEQVDTWRTDSNQRIQRRLVSKWEPVDE